ncbi:MAG: ATP-binding cassette domain-containing protein, partial [Actinomycetota bacterium]|nr:ATP-binding cassette domain-containing protein [Actinomycetota bacterium]
MTQGTPILQVRDLRTYFHTADGVVKAVDGVDLQVDKGEILGLVGESGCGKSVTSLSVLRLVPFPGRVEEGQILYQGRDLLTLSKEEMAE